HTRFSRDWSSDVCSSDLPHYRAPRVAARRGRDAAMTRRLPIIHGITEHDAGPYRLERLDLEFGNGERRRYERLHGRGHGAVAVVPMLDDDTVLLVREYAAGVHRYGPDRK